MNKEDTLNEKAGLILSMLHYAYEHKLDITNKEAVKQILKEFKLSYADEKEVDQFMQLLQDADTVMDIVAKKAKKPELPN